MEIELDDDLIIVRRQGGESMSFDLDEARILKRRLAELLFDPDAWNIEIPADLTR